MESEERMTLHDLPVNTRNYTIIDNITGKPIEQNNYTLSIDEEVIKKLNKLKTINEEKVKQAALKAQYGDTNLVQTYTPENNAVFTPVYQGEYIDYHDYQTTPVAPTEETPAEEVNVELETMPTETVQDEGFKPTEVIQSDTLLDRVVARDPSTIPQEVVETPAEEEPKEELDYIHYDAEPTNEEGTQNVDNSLFTPEMAGLQQASEQIVKINEERLEKLGPGIKPPKEPKKGTERIELDKMEVISGRGIAWMAYILFFIPLLFKGRNRFVRLHANEGLELNLIEILGGLMVAQYFLLPTWIENFAGIGATISLIAGIIGGALLITCVFTAVIMMIISLCGIQAQTPWLWHKRLLHVPTERIID